MAVTTIAITGKVLGPDGSAPTSGSIAASLSQPVMATDGTTSDWIMGSFSAQLVAGAIPNSFKLIANDAMTPSGTVYRVTYSLVLADGSPFSWSEFWSLASNPNSIDIGAITRAAAPNSAIFVEGPPGPAGAGAGAIPSYDIGAIPTASLALMSSFILVTQANAPTQIQMCVPNSSGGYEWTVLQQST